MGRVFGRISFFVNAGVRFVEEHAKLRAMGVAVGGARPRALRRAATRKHLRFRYGVQVNSLGLTESQPENNVQRIVLEALAVTLGRNARARAIQLPAWNEALGLPRPWDQQWSLRIQQVLAYETDLLEYPDLFEGSKVMDGLVAELLEGARAEMAIVDEHGGAVGAVDYMKAALVDSHRERIRRIEAGEQVIVGVNRYTEAERSPLLDGRRRRHPHRRSGGRGAAARGGRALARRARPGRGRRGAGDPARGGGGRRQHHGGDARRRARRRDDRRVGRGAARGVRRVPRAHRRGRGGRRAGRLGRARGAARGGRPRQRGARAAAEDPRRQAGPRRALQRRRADRRARARHRHGRRLRGHPPDAVADRRQRAAGGRPRRGPVDPLGLAPRADPHRRADAARPRRRRAGGGRRDHPRGRRRAAAGGGRRGGLHAQGLRPDADHARHRGAGGGAPRSRLPARQRAVARLS